MRGTRSCALSFPRTDRCKVWQLEAVKLEADTFRGSSFRWSRGQIAVEVWQLEAVKLKAGTFRGSSFGWSRGQIAVEVWQLEAVKRKAGTFRGGFLGLSAAGFIVVRDACVTLM